MSAEEMVVIKKRLETMDPLCCIYYIQFKNLVDENVLGPRKNTIGNKDFISVDPPHNVQKDRHAAKF